MVVRTAGALLSAALFGMVAPGSAQAGEMSVEQARKFVVGKTFVYRCFDGTRGAGRVGPDGSLTGTVQMRGAGPQRFARFPANTLQVKGARVCASVKGALFEPCFSLEQTSDTSFRGSVSGMGFAYCDFTHGKRGRVMRTANRERGKPMSLRSSFTE